MPVAPGPFLCVGARSAMYASIAAAIFFDVKRSLRALAYIRTVVLTLIFLSSAAVLGGVRALALQGGL